MEFILGTVNDVSGVESVLNNSRSSLFATECSSFAKLYNNIPISTTKVLPELFVGGNLNVSVKPVFSNKVNDLSTHFASIIDGEDFANKLIESQDYFFSLIIKLDTIGLQLADRFISNKISLLSEDMIKEACEYLVRNYKADTIVKIEAQYKEFGQNTSVKIFENFFLDAHVWALMFFIKDSMNPIILRRIFIVNLFLLRYPARDYNVGCINFVSLLLEAKNIKAGDTEPNPDKHKSQISVRYIDEHFLMGLVNVLVSIRTIKASVIFKHPMVLAIIDFALFLAKPRPSTEGEVITIEFALNKMKIEADATIAHFKNKVQNFTGGVVATQPIEEVANKCEASKNDLTTMIANSSMKDEELNFISYCFAFQNIKKDDPTPSTNICLYFEGDINTTMNIASLNLIEEHEDLDGLFGSLCASFNSLESFITNFINKYGSIGGMISEQENIYKSLIVIQSFINNCLQRKHSFEICCASYMKRYGSYHPTKDLIDLNDQFTSYSKYGFRLDEIIDTIANFVNLFKASHIILKGIFEKYDGTVSLDQDLADNISTYKIIEVDPILLQKLQANYSLKDTANTKLEQDIDIKIQNFTFILETKVQDFYQYVKDQEAILKAWVQQQSQKTKILEDEERKLKSQLSSLMAVPTPTKMSSLTKNDIEKQLIEAYSKPKAITELFVKYSVESTDEMDKIPLTGMEQIIYTMFDKGQFKNDSKDFTTKFDDMFRPIQSFYSFWKTRYKIIKNINKESIDPAMLTASLLDISMPLVSSVPGTTPMMVVSPLPPFASIPPTPPTAASVPPPPPPPTAAASVPPSLPVSSQPVNWPALLVYADGLKKHDDYTEKEPLKDCEDYITIREKVSDDIKNGSTQYKRLLTYMETFITPRIMKSLKTHTPIDKNKVKDLLEKLELVTSSFILYTSNKMDKYSGELGSINPNGLCVLTTWNVQNNQPLLVQSSLDDYLIGDCSDSTFSCIKAKSSINALVGILPSTKKLSKGLSKLRTGIQNIIPGGVKKDKAYSNSILLNVEPVTNENNVTSTLDSAKKTLYEKNNSLNEQDILKTSLLLKTALEKTNIKELGKVLARIDGKVSNIKPVLDDSIKSVLREISEKDMRSVIEKKIKIASEYMVPTEGPPHILERNQIDSYGQFWTQAKEFEKLDSTNKGLISVGGEVGPSKVPIDVLSLFKGLNESGLSDYLQLDEMKISMDPKKLKFLNIDKNNDSFSISPELLINAVVSTLKLQKPNSEVDLKDFLSNGIGGAPLNSTLVENPYTLLKSILFNDNPVFELKLPALQDDKLGAELLKHLNKNGVNTNITSSVVEQFDLLENGTIWSYINAIPGVSNALSLGEKIVWVLKFIHYSRHAIIIGTLLYNLYQAYWAPPTSSNESSKRDVDTKVKISYNPVNNVITTVNNSFKGENTFTQWRTKLSSLLETIPQVDFSFPMLIKKLRSLSKNKQVDGDELQLMHLVYKFLAFHNHANSYELLSYILAVEDVNINDINDYLKFLSVDSEVFDSSTAKYEIYTTSRNEGYDKSYKTIYSSSTGIEYDDSKIKDPGIKGYIRGYFKQLFTTYADTNGVPYYYKISAACEKIDFYRNLITNLKSKESIHKQEEIRNVAIKEVEKKIEYSINTISKKSSYLLSKIVLRYLDIQLSSTKRYYSIVSCFYRSLAKHTNSVVITYLTSFNDNIKNSNSNSFYKSLNEMKFDDRYYLDTSSGVFDERYIEKLIQEFALYNNEDMEFIQNNNIYRYGISDENTLRLIFQRCYQLSDALFEYYSVMSALTQSGISNGATPTVNKSKRSKKTTATLSGLFGAFSLPIILLHNVEDYQSLKQVDVGTLRKYGKMFSSYWNSNDIVDGLVQTINDEVVVYMDPNTAYNVILVFALSVSVSEAEFSDSNIKLYTGDTTQSLTTPLFEQFNILLEMIRCEYVNILYSDYLLHNLDDTVNISGVDGRGPKENARIVINPIVSFTEFILSVKTSKCQNRADVLLNVTDIDIRKELHFNSRLLLILESTKPLHSFIVDHVKSFYAFTDVKEVDKLFESNFLYSVIMEGVKTTGQFNYDDISCVVAFALVYLKKRNFGLNENILSMFDHIIDDKLLDFERVNIKQKSHKIMDTRQYPSPDWNDFEDHVNIKDPIICPPRNSTPELLMTSSAPVTAPVASKEVFANDLGYFASIPARIDPHYLQSLMNNGSFPKLLESNDKKALDILFPNLIKLSSLPKEKETLLIESFDKMLSSLPPSTHKTFMSNSQYLKDGCRFSIWSSFIERNVPKQKDFLQFIISYMKNVFYAYICNQIKDFAKNYSPLDINLDYCYTVTDLSAVKKEDLVIVRHYMSDDLYSVQNSLDIQQHFERVEIKRIDLHTFVL